MFADFQLILRTILPRCRDYSCRAINNTRRTWPSVCVRPHNVAECYPSVGLSEVGNSAHQLIWKEAHNETRKYQNAPKREKKEGREN